MVDIALDPNMYYPSMSTADTLRKAADLGFEYVELSPNSEFHFWHRYPKADDDFVAGLNKAQAETGVKVRTLNPVFNWSSTDEVERLAQVRNWRRLLELADQIDVREITSEFSGNPNTPRQCEDQWYRSIEELTPVFEQYGIRLNMEAHPYDFVELHDDAINLIRGVNLDWIGTRFCCPPPSTCPTVPAMSNMIQAPPRSCAVRVADALNLAPAGITTSSTRRAWTRVHQHAEIG